MSRLPLPLSLGLLWGALAAAALSAAAPCRAGITPAGFYSADPSSISVHWDSDFPPGTAYRAVLSSGAFPNSFSGNASSDTLNDFAGFTGLSANQAYYLAVATDPAGPYTDLGSTITAPAVPGHDPSGMDLSGVTTTGLTVAWSSGTAAEGYNAGGTLFEVEAATSADFSTIFASMQLPAYTLTATSELAPNTTYFFRVAAVGGGGSLSDFLDLGSTATLAAVPGAPAPAFTAVSVSGLTARWAAGDGSADNPDGTIYQVQLSTRADFAPPWASSRTTELAWEFSGLDAQKTYYARVQALGSGNEASAYASLGSTVTTADAGLTPLGFIQVTSTGMFAGWTSAYGAGVTYYAVLSTGPLPNAYSGNASSATLNLHAEFSGLIPNATYYGRVSTAAAGPYTDLGFMSTLATEPGGPVGVATYTAVTSFGLAIHWSSGTPGVGYNVAGTTYVFQASKAPDFSSLFATVATTDTFFATDVGLEPSTTYYGRVAAVSNDGTLSGGTDLGAVSTLAVPPEAPAGPAFSGVSVAGLSVSWSSGTEGAYNGDGTFYLVELSTMASFDPVWASSRTAVLHASFAGLDGGKSYFAQVEALNNSGGATPFVSLGSTVTTSDAGLTAAGLDQIGSSGFTASWDSAFAPGTLYYAVASSGTLPNSFSGNVSSATLNQFAAFTGLTPNSTYFAQVSTAAAGPFFDLDSAVTTAAAPEAPGAGAYTQVSTDGFVVSWASGSAAAGYNPFGTLYRVQVAFDPGYSSLFATVLTTGTALSADSILDVDTLYYTRVAAFNNDGSATAYTDLGSTSTLALAPAAPGGEAFAAVASHGFTVSWSSGSPAGGYNRAGSLYQVQVSADPGFDPVAASTVTTDLSADFAQLDGNTAYYARVQAVSAAGAGTAFADLGSTTTLPTTGVDPAGFPAVAAAALTVSWSSGLDPGTTYYTRLSTAPFPNFLSNLSSDTLNLSADFSGLIPATRYYAETSTQTGTGPFYGLGSTVTLAVPPQAPSGGSAFSAVSPAGLTLAWSSGTAGGYDPAGTPYLAQLSLDSGFGSVAASSQTFNLSAAFAGLSGNATYYARARAANPAGTATAFTLLGSTITPAAAPVAPGSPFIAVGPSSAAVSWTSADLDGTTFYAQLSPVADFSSGAASSRTYATSAAFQGLSPNATYYARAAAFDVASGTWTAFTSLGSAITAAVLPGAPAASAFTAVSASGLTLNWSSGTASGGYDPAGTLYLAQVSAAPDFSAPVSSWTRNVGASFTGLAPNADYFARVEAFNGDLVDTGFLGLGSTATLAAAPAAPAGGGSPFSAVSETGLTVSWSSGPAGGGYDPADTLYTVELATTPSFGTLTGSQQTLALSADFAGLSVNATYYARVSAAGRGGDVSAYADLGSTSTLAAAPALPADGAAFGAVFASSLTVSWSSGTEAGGYDPDGTVYELELSPEPGFDTVTASSRTFNLFAALSNLDALTVYYARARARDNLGVPTAYADLGSTKTANGGLTPAGFSAVTSTALSVGWLSVFPGGTAYHVQASTEPPPNSFSGNASSTTFNLFAALTGLSPNTVYHAAVSTAAEGTFTTLGSTLTPAAAPAPPPGSAFSAVSQSALTLSWSSGTAASGFDPEGTLYDAQLSTAADFSSVLADSQTYNPGAGFAGLSPGTVYFARALAYDSGGGATSFTDLGSTATPAALPGPGSPVFAAVAVSSLTVAWTDGGDPPGTTFYVQLAADAGFGAVLASTETPELSAGFTGLPPGATVYARAAAYDPASSTWTAFALLGSTGTLAAEPGAGVPAFSAVSAAGLTVAWSSGTPAEGYDPAGTFYLARLSQAPDFSSIAFSSLTLSLDASFAGLQPNASYYAQVQAFNGDGTATAFADLGSTITLAAAPGSSPDVSTFTALLTTGLTLAWSSGTAAGGFNPPGTAYLAQLSTAPGFATVAASSLTYALSADFGGLAPNLTYYARAEALNGAGMPTAFAGLGSASTLAVPPGAPGGDAFSSVLASAFTVSWSSGTQGLGYDADGTAYVAEISTEPGFDPLWASSRTASLSAGFAGLDAGASYYARVQAVGNGGETTAFADLGSTVTPSAASLLPSVFSSVGSAGLTAEWLSSFAPGTAYYAVLSTGPLPNAFSGNRSSTTLNLFAGFAGLDPAAAYYARVSTDAAGPYTDLGSTLTLAVPPAAPAPGSPFSSVYTSSLTVLWSSGTAGGGYDPPGTLYLAQLSTASDFSHDVLSSSTLNLSAAFTGLLGSATYFARVQAFNPAGTATAFADLGSTVTRSGLPTAAGTSFPAVGAASLTMAWLGNNPPDTDYYAQLSTAPDFSAVAASSRTKNQTADFSGLAPNAAYYAQTAAYDAGTSTWSAFTPLGSTATLALAPGPASSTFSAVSGTGLTLAWSSGTQAGGYDPADTLYLARLSSDPGFSSVLASSLTLDTSATFAGLEANATYYAQARAFNRGGVPTAFTSFGSTVTPVQLPGQPSGSTFTAVSQFALTVRWSSGTEAAGFDAAGTAYLVELSSQAGFSPLAGSSRTLSLSASFSGLSYSTTYYARVRAFAADGAPTAFVDLGSTSTPGGIAPAGFSGVSALGLTAAWSSAFAPGTLYRAQLSSGPFPNGFSANRSSDTLNSSAAFAGLTPDTTYYLQVATAAAGPFWDLGSTITLAAVPGPPGGAVFASVSTGSLALAWSSGTAGGGYNPLGTTLYRAELSTSAAFATTASASAGYGPGSAFGGLSPNATYYARVRAANAAGQATAFLVLGATSTLAAPPGAPASAFAGVTGNALTLLWSSGTAALGYDPAGTLYEAELSTSAGFSPTAASSRTLNLSAGFSGLAPNAAYYARVRAVGNGGDVTAYADLGSTATPTAVPGAAPFGAVGASSVTARWLSNGNPAGTTYYAQLAADSGFSSILASSTTLNVSAVFGGLSLNATYYARAAAYSLNTSTWTAFTSLGAAVTLAADPAAPALGQVFVSSLSFTWSAGGNPPGTAYLAALSTDAFAGVAASSATLSSSATFFNLAANATYYLAVRAVSHEGVTGAFVLAGSTWTAPASPVSSPPTAVGAAAVTLTWGDGGNAPGTFYLAQASTDAFASVTSSSGVWTTTAALSGLAANTPYAFRVRAVGSGGLATAFTALPSTTTLLLPPAPAGAAFSGVSATALAAAWSAGGNGPGTVYDAQLSTDGFATVSAASSTLNLAASFAGLRGNTAYSARVRASGSGNVSAFLALGSTSTLAAPPGPAVSSFTAVSSSALTLAWSSGTPAGGFNGPGTLYLAQLSTGPAFASLTASSQTYNLAAAFSGLSPDAAYYARVQAFNADGLATAFADLGSTATPAALPSAAAYSAVAYSSITARWLDAANPAGTEYYARLSTAADFSAILASSRTFDTQATFTGLGLNVTYYAQVAAFDANASTWSAFTGLGAVSTLAQAPAAAALAQVGVSTLSFTWSAAGNPPWTVYQADLSTDAFLTAAASSRTLSASATFYGLLGNATYFLRVRAFNGDGAATAFAALPSTWTDTAAPAPLPTTGVTFSSVTLNWDAAGNAPVTLYEAQASADGFSTVAAASSTYASSAQLTGLLANTAYALRVRAVGNGGRPTAYVVLPGTTTLLLPPAAAADAFAAVGQSSVTALWASGGNGPGTTFQAQLSTDAFATVNAASSTLDLWAVFGAGGLGPALVPNTAYYARVRAVSGPAQSAFVALGSTITLAAPPSGTAAANVAVTSASVSWSLGANPPATVAEVQQSTDGVAYASIFSGAAVSLADGGLLQCTTYWVRVRNLNASGLYTAFDVPASFVTKASTPGPALALAADPTAGNRVSLSWTPSPSEGIARYKLFYDGGTGAVSYAAPLAVLASTETSFTTGVLPSSGTYLFALRAENRCGVSESTGVFASAGSTAALAAVRAAVSAPDSGKRVAGNAVSLVASLSSGAPDRVASIRFQFRASGAASWTDVASADGSHPNPAAAQPFFIHWDVTGLAPGSYDLRAVALDVDGSTDTTPSGITVVVDPLTPDISESVVGGQTKKIQTINTAVTNVIQVAGTGADDLLTKLVLPAGALTGSTVAVTVISNYALPSQPPAGVTVAGNAMQVTLSNGQSLLAGGLTAPVTLSYPGTVGDASVLQIYTLNEGTGLWSKDFSSTSDPVTHTVTGSTPHFSVFVVVNAGVVTADLSGARVWPNPYKPFGGNPDEGRAFSLADPASGIIFDHLPARVSLKIYTITGQLVAHFETAQSSGRIQWDARNDAGHDVASGVYMAVIASPGVRTAVRKVAILR